VYNLFLCMCFAGIFFLIYVNALIIFDRTIVAIVSAFSWTFTGMNVAVFFCPFSYLIVTSFHKDSCIILGNNLRTVLVISYLCLAGSIRLPKYGPLLWKPLCGLRWTANGKLLCTVSVNKQSHCGPIKSLLKC
jgi:hypothetical protein